MMQRSNPILNFVDSPIKVEILAFLLAIVTLIWTMDSTLVRGRTTLTHDAFYFTLPLYHHLINSLEAGIIPFWNPYTHAGEPIYPSLFHCQFYDPISIAVAYLGPIFTQNRTLIFNWNHFIHSTLMLIGSYLFLRKVARAQLTRILLIAILFFSSFSLASYRQIGFLYQFQWVPWVIWTFDRIFSENKTDWKNFSLLGSFVGLQMQSYWFTGLAVLLLFAGLGALRFFRVALNQIHAIKSFYKKCGFTLFLISLASAPNFVLYFSQEQWVSSARTNQTLTHSLPVAPKLYEDEQVNNVPISHFSWNQIQTSGTSSNLWNFLQLVTHRGNSFIHKKKYAFGTGSEAWMYFGIIPFLLMLMGVLYGQAIRKSLWILVLIGTGTLMLGPVFPPNQIIFLLYPPLRLLRHYSTLVCLFSFVLLYFFTLGMDWFLENTRFPSSIIKISILFSTSILMFGLASYWNPFPKFYLIYISILGLLPFLFLIILRRRTTSPLVPILLFVVPVLFDLACATNQSRSIYKGQVSPEMYLPVKKQSFPKHREPYPQYPFVHFLIDPIPEQSPRYIGIYHQKTYALSELLGREGEFYLSFQEALKSIRWNSFLLQKSYFQLLHSDIPAEALKKIFAIYEPLIQFKSLAIFKPSDQIGSFLKSIENVDSFFKYSVIIDSDQDIFLNKIPSTNLYASHRILFQTTNELRIETKTNRDSFLYWSDGFDPNWSAYLDGKVVPILRANINFKAIQVPQGIHDLRFTYSPKLFKISLFLFYLGTLSSTIFFVLWRLGCQILISPESRHLGPPDFRKSLPSW